MASIKKGINNQLFIDSSGNVGIGGNVPIDKLQVNGSLFVTGKIYNGSTNDSAGITFPSSSTRIDGFNGITFHASSTNVGSQSERMRITSAGNVGIGTTSPFNKLTVGSVPASGYGLITISADWASGSAISTGIKIGAAADTGGAGVDIRSHSNYAATSGTEMSFWTNSTGNVLSERMRLGSDGSLSFSITSDTSFPSASIKHNSNNYVYFSGGSNGALFGNSNQQVRLQVNATNMEFLTGGNTKAIIASNGNVGIGTTSPVAKLQITDGNALLYTLNSSNNITLQYAPGNIDGQVRGQIVFDTPGSEPSYVNGSDAYKWKIATVGSLGTGPAYYNSDLRFLRTTRLGVTDSAVMTLNGFTGNVGIGTSAPLAPLNIGVDSVTASPIRAIKLGEGTSVVGNGQYIQFSTSTVDSLGSQIQGVRAGAGAASDLRFLTTNTSSVVSEKLRIDSSGNVGIGTTSPGARLHVVSDNLGGTAGDQSIQSYFFNNNGNTSFLEIKDVRTSTGANWTFAAKRIQMRVDSTYMGYVQFNGTGNNAGISFGAGTTTTAPGNVSERMRITEAGNVGIGTTSPVSKLDVAGAGYFSGESLSAGLDQTYTNVGLLIDEGDYIYTKDSSTTLRILMGKIADIIKIGQNGTSLIDAIELIPGTTGGRVSIFDNTTETVRFQNGNVGIGTTNPTVPLQIVKDNATISMTNTTAFAVDTGSRLFLGGKYDTAGTTSPFAWIVGAKENATDGNQAGYLSITTVANGGGFAERMRVTSTGNVGIGTTSPDVYSFGGGRILTVSSTSTYSVLVLASGNANSGGISMGNQTIRRAAIDHLDGSHLVFYTNGTNSGTTVSERLRITSAGNVGIGTTSPENLLHIKAADGVTGVLKIEGGKNTVTSVGEINSRLDFGSNDASVWSSGNVGGRIASVTEATNGAYTGMAFYTFKQGVSSPDTLSEKLRITHNGNVGIGTDSPGRKLHVNGDVQVDTNLVVNSGIYNTTYYAGSSTATYFKNSVASDTLTILESGNVGIGTTAPAFKLEVNAGSNAGMWLQGSSDVRYHAFSSSSNDWVGYELRSSNVNSFAGGMFRNNGANNRVSLYNKNSEAISLMDTGNVGIGTTAPTNRLTVTTATNAVDVLRLNNTGGDSGAVQGVTHLAINHFNGGTNPSTRITAYQDSTSGWPGGMYFSTRSLNTDSAPLERMRITSAGNVGIGTTSPQYLLDVNGDAQINAEGFGPDYVYVPDGEFGLDSLITSGSENVALGKPDVWLRIHVDGVAFVFPGYQEA
jgi:hypothetical protein